MKNGDKPAYPILDKLVTQGVDQGLELKHPGLTKREYFAAMAMQGLLSKYGYDSCDSHGISADAVNQADELLNKLEQ